MTWVSQSPFCYADLHLHSTASDGVLSPAELAIRLNSLRVQIAALTDHDNLDGIVEFKKHFKGRCIHGVELSVTVDGEDVHLLGYNFSLENREFNEALVLYRKTRHERISLICDKLAGLGMPLNPQDILDDGDENAYGRPHIARLLLARGYVRSTQEAFDKYLRTHGPAYVHKHKMTLKEGITLIHGAGGLAVLAHPGLYFRSDLMEKIIASDIDGVELSHPNHNDDMKEQIRRAFNGKADFYTGGSDFHGNMDGRDNLALFGLDFDEWVHIKNHFE